MVPSSVFLIKSFLSWRCSPMLGKLSCLEFGLYLSYFSFVF